MNRYLVEISATMIVDSHYDIDDIATGIAARLEEIAMSSEHLLDYAYGGANVSIHAQDNKFSLENELQKSDKYRASYGNI